MDEIIEGSKGDLINSIARNTKKNILTGGLRKLSNATLEARKEGKSSLESQKQQEHFCRQVSLRRGMRQEFDRSLGKVNYIHIERKNVTQIVVYIPLKTIFVTVEPELSMIKKLQVVNRIKRIITNLKKTS